VAGYQMQLAVLEAVVGTELFHNFCFTDTP